MTFQRILIRLFLASRLRPLGRSLLRHRVWTIEGGEASGLKLQLPQNLDYLSGSSEIPVQRTLAQHLGPGQVFYDIGANMGFFSLLAARKIGSSGSVHAFEPLAENAANVRANAKLNRFGNISVHEVAVGGTSRAEELILTSWDGGTSLASAAIKPSTPLSTRMVPVVALDEFISEKDLPLPTCVKIDVEGAELDVMRGMAGIIAEAKPILLYEVDDGNEDSFQQRWLEMDGYIKGFDYSITHLEPSYPSMRWHVGHSLAIPRRTAASSL